MPVSTRDHRRDHRRDRWRDHWREVWRDRAEDSVSWYEPTPARSLELIAALAPDRHAAILDVGGGESRLVDGLIAEGYHDLTVLDIAEPALEQVRARLGASADQVRWIVGDVLGSETIGSFDLWHDRAVFHFLVDAEDRDDYRRRLHGALRPGGVAVVATFGAHAPQECSGLPVRRYTAAELVEELGDGVVCARAVTDVHRTPNGVDQEFTFVAMRRDP